MADEITLEQDIDEVLGMGQPAEATLDLPAATNVEPEDDEDDGSDDGDGDGEDDEA